MLAISWIESLLFTKILTIFDMLFSLSSFQIDLICAWFSRKDAGKDGIMTGMTTSDEQQLGIITAAVLLVGLNVMLLFFHGESQETSRSFQIFHGLMIAIGVYSVMLLAPGKVTRYLE